MPFSSKPSHKFLQKATFEDFPIKPTSEGIKETKLSSLFVLTLEQPGAPNENIVQNHLNIALLNVFLYLNGRYRHIFIPKNFSSVRIS